MILQQLQYPNPDICDCEKMFFRADDKVRYERSLKAFLFEKKGVLSFNTYFNSFSSAKWKKYTLLDNLSLALQIKGVFSLRLYAAISGETKDDVTHSLLAEQMISCQDGEVLDIQVNFPALSDQGINYFELECLSDTGKLLNACYLTEIDEKNKKDVRLAVGICTFRREAYVQKNLEILTREIATPDSDLFHRVDIFVSDNGQTLPESLNSDFVHIYPNKNLGGSGGFARSMIEILKVKEEKGYTHFLLMDDDIVLNPEAIRRNIRFLSLLREDYKDAFLGGQMVKLDERNLQSEAADFWNDYSQSPVKYKRDLTEEWNVIDNEVEKPVNYLSWWYCCMPIDLLSASNLPIPVFIKRDDIEYGLRNGKQFITLNGVCVWHESFEYKYSPFLEYYYMRNACIMNARHRPQLKRRHLTAWLLKRMAVSICRFRYPEAELTLMGVQDYLRGIDWLLAQDGERINQMIMKFGDRKKPLEELTVPFDEEQYLKSVDYENENALRKLIRKISFNTWLFPSKHTVIVPTYRPAFRLFYRAKQVLNYEEATNSGFVTEKSYRKAFTILKHFLSVERQIIRDFPRVNAEYRARFDEMTNLDFWNEYLARNGEPIERTSILER